MRRPVQALPRPIHPMEFDFHPMEFDFHPMEMPFHPMEMPFHPMDERRALVCKCLIESLLLFCGSWLLLRAVRQ